MDFIMDNFVLIIVIVIVILMAIVGYIADITDFGRKEFKKKITDNSKKEKTEKPKKEKKDKKKKEVIEEPVINNDVNIENNDYQQTDMGNMNFDNMNSENVVNNMDDNLESVSSYDLNNEINDTVEDNEPIDQSLFEPLPSIDQVFSEPIDNQQSVDDNLSNEESEVQSEDDIWKF